MLIIQKIFLVTISQRRDDAPNTLPIKRERIFTFVLQKNFLSIKHIRRKKEISPINFLKEIYI